MLVGIVIVSVVGLSRNTSHTAHVFVLNFMATHITHGIRKIIPNEYDRNARLLTVYGPTAEFRIEHTRM